MPRTSLALLLVLAACERSDGVHATRAQCERLDAELGAMVDRVNTGRGSDSRWFKIRVFGERGPELCVERMTGKQVECMIAKYRADSMDTSGCVPEVDLRPPDARHTLAECERYVAKVRMLATGATPPAHLAADEYVKAATDGATRECAGWLSKARYECVLAATTDDARHACPP